MNRLVRTGLLASLAAALPTLAFAHTGHGADGFAHGVLHPLTGLDHLLAMVAVGIFAGQLGGRALWAVPATFLALMAAGGMLGVAGIDVPWVEIGIAGSVIALGGAIALGLRAPLAVAMAVTGLFAIFHGHAHGTEIPEAASGAAYGLGFLLATAALHLAGIGLGTAIGRTGSERGAVLVQGTGAAIAVAGIAILAGIA
ncbi:HupE/UreJ family protein [Aquabacter spiritensis]|uniref:Urease accessory protein n=1 Tax=Aquabacter spiritensis TaxID=933073 RepID=A0A4R3LY45_9HYPH|nr:HupE/UreJ family protein [Aquabacter spiritensis]TCT05604.1 urease accessory protein [Aquabacter spiritensis]